MAGHSKFKNIQHRKGAQDKKRAKIFTKLVKEIITAARLGGPDQSSNPRLRTAIIAARAQNLPKERIDRAIAQSSDNTNTENYFEIRYEGFAPGGIAIIVEALTDNKNRTAAYVRAAFTKFGGNLGETGSVSFNFDHVGFIEYSAENITADAMLEASIDAGAMDVESDENMHIVYVAVEDFNNCLEILSGIFGPPTDSYIGWKAQNLITIENKDRAEKLLKLINTLEDSEDVQQVFGNYEFSDEIDNIDIE